MVQSIDELLGAPQPELANRARREIQASQVGAGAQQLRNRRVIRDATSPDRQMELGPEIPTVPTSGFVDNFAAGFRIGGTQLAADVTRFGAIGRALVGDQDGSEEALRRARAFDLDMQKISEDLKPFEQLIQAPSFEGGIDFAGKALGQFTPMMIGSLASGFAGAGSALLGRYALSQTGRGALQEMFSNTIRKKVLRDEALDPLESKVMNAVQGMGRTAAAGGIAGAGTQEYIVGAAQSLAELEEAGLNLTREEMNSALAMGVPQALLGVVADTAFAGSLYKLIFRRSAIGRLRQKEAQIEFEKKLSGGEAKTKLSESELELKRIADKARTTNVEELDAGSVLTPKELAIYKAAIGTPPSLGKLMKDVAFATGISSGVEGATEFLQEELLISQRQGVDPNFSEEEARLRRAEAFFAGAIAGGGRSAVTSPVASVFKQAREQIDLVRENETREAIRDDLYRGQQELEDEVRESVMNIVGEITENDIKAGAAEAVRSKTSPEPESQIRAQLRSMLRGDKPSMFIPENTVNPGLVDRITRRKGVFSATVPGVGVYLSTSKDAIQEVFEYKNDTALLSSEAFIADFLGYSNAKRETDDRVVVVTDKKGNVISEQATDKDGEKFAIEKARKFYSEKDGYEVSVKDPEDVLLDRQNLKRLEEAEKAAQRQATGQQELDFETRGSIDDELGRDPNDFEAQQDAFVPEDPTEGIPVDEYDEGIFETALPDDLDAELLGTGASATEFTSQGVREGSVAEVETSAALGELVDIETARNKQGKPFGDKTKQLFINARNRYRTLVSDGGQITLPVALENDINLMTYQIIDKLFELQNNDPESVYRIVRRVQPRDRFALDSDVTEGRAPRLVDTVEELTGPPLVAPPAPSEERFVIERLSQRGAYTREGEPIDVSTRATILRGLERAKKDGAFVGFDEATQTQIPSPTWSRVEGKFNFMVRTPNKTTKTTRTDPETGRTITVNTEVSPKPINMNRLLFSARDAFLNEQPNRKQTEISMPYSQQLAQGFMTLLDILQEQPDGFYTKIEASGLPSSETLTQIIYNEFDEDGVYKRSIDLTDPEQLSEFFKIPIYFNNNRIKDEDGTYRKIGYQSIDELAAFSQIKDDISAANPDRDPIQNTSPIVSKLMGLATELSKRLRIGDPVEREQKGYSPSPSRGVQELDKDRRTLGTEDTGGTLLNADIPIDRKALGAALPSLRNVSTQTQRETVVDFNPIMRLEDLKPLPDTVKTLIVSGTRFPQNVGVYGAYQNQAYVDAVLDRIIGDRKDITIMEGGAEFGADALAAKYAQKRGLKHKQKKANWDVYGRGAGFVRNREMAREANGEVKIGVDNPKTGATIAFWDGQSNGTRHQIRESLIPQDYSRGPFEPPIQYNEAAVVYVVNISGRDNLNRYTPGKIQTAFLRAQTLKEASERISATFFGGKTLNAPGRPFARGDEGRIDFDVLTPVLTTEDVRDPADKRRKLTKEDGRPVRQEVVDPESRSITLRTGLYEDIKNSLSPEFRTKFDAVTQAFNRTFGGQSIGNRQDRQMFPPYMDDMLNIWYGSGNQQSPDGSMVNFNTLSNLAPRKFTFKGKEYKSVEHAYQTLKTGVFKKEVYERKVWNKAGGIYKDRVAPKTTKEETSKLVTFAPFRDLVKLEKEGKGINTMRNRPGKYNFGNPFSHLPQAAKGTIKVKTLEEAVDNFKSWLEGSAFETVRQDQRNWILKQINEGRLVGKQLLYYNDPSSNPTLNHALIIAEKANSGKEDAYNEKLMEDLMTASFEQNAAARDTLLASEDKLFTHYQERSKDADSFTWAQTFPRLLLKVRRKVGGKEPNIPRALATFKRDLKMDLSKDIDTTVSIRTPTVTVLTTAQGAPTFTPNMRSLSFLGIAPGPKNLIALAIGALNAIASEGPNKQIILDSFLKTIEDEAIRQANDNEKGFSITEILRPIPEEHHQVFRDAVEAEIKERVGFIKTLLTEGEKGLPIDVATRLRLDAVNEEGAQIDYAFPMLGAAAADGNARPTTKGSKEAIGMIEPDEAKRMLLEMEDFLTVAQEELANATGEFADAALVRGGGIGYSPEGRAIGDREDSSVFDRSVVEEASAMGSDVLAGMYQGQSEEYDNEVRNPKSDPNMHRANVFGLDSQGVPYQQSQAATLLERKRGEEAALKAVVDRDAKYVEEFAPENRKKVNRGKIGYSENINAMFSSQDGTPGTGADFIRGFKSAVENVLGFRRFDAATFVITDDDNLVFENIGSTLEERTVTDSEGRKTTESRVVPQTFPNVPIRRLKKKIRTPRFGREFEQGEGADPVTATGQPFTGKGQPYYETVKSLQGTKQVNEYIKTQQQRVKNNPNAEAARVLKFGNANIIILKSLPEKANRNDVATRILSMAHEFGHVFLWESQKDLLKPNTTNRNKLLDSLRKAYERDRDNLDEPYYESEYGFEEWFADQFAKAVVKLTARQGTSRATNSEQQRVNQYFIDKAKKVVDFLKKITGVFAKRFGKGDIAPEFNQFIQAVTLKYKNKIQQDNNDGVPPANTIFAVRDAIFDIETTKDSVIQSAKDVAKKTRKSLKAPRSSRNHWSWRYLLYPSDNTLEYYADKEARSPREAAVIRKIRRSTYTRSRTRREALGTSFLNIHPNVNARVYNSFTEIFGLKDPTFLDQDERDMVIETLELAEDYENYPTLDELAKKSTQAARVRKFLDKFYITYLSDVGINYRKDFFPRSLFIYKILQNKNGEQAKLATLLKERNPQARSMDWNEYVRKMLIDDDAVIDNINPDTRIDDEDLTDVAVGGRRDRSRYFLNISNKDLRDIGVLKDPIEAVREYMNSMVKRAVFNRAYITSLDDISPKAREALERKGIYFSRQEKSAGQVTGWKSLEADLAELAVANPSLERKVRHMVKGMLGKAGQDMTSGFRNLNSFFLFFNSITLLTLAPLASLPDLAGPMLFSADTAAFKDAKQVLKQYFSEEGGKEKLREFAFDVGAVSADSLSMYYINAAEQNYMTPMFRKGTDYFFRYTFLEGFTIFSRVFATGMARQFLVRAADAAKKGDRVKAEQLRGLNVTPAEVDAWVADGKIISNEHQRIKEAIAQFVDESIVRPNAAERPGWANNPYFAMVWQLKSFYYAYGKNIMGGLGRLSKTKAGQENMTAGVAPLIMGAVLLAPLTMLGLEIRELLKYLVSGGDPRKLRTNSMDLGDYSFEILDRSGILGPLGLLIPMYEAGKYGDFPLGPAAGPTFERIEDLIFDFELKQNIPVVGTIL